MKSNAKSVQFSFIVILLHYLCLCAPSVAVVFVLNCGHMSLNRNRERETITFNAFYLPTTKRLKVTMDGSLIQMEINKSKSDKMNRFLRYFRAINIFIWSFDVVLWQSTWRLYSIWWNFHFTSLSFSVSHSSIARELTKRWSNSFNL